MSKGRSYQRSRRLEALGFANYRAYLRSPRWAAVRARYRASDLPQDCMCGETDGLQFHHLTYERVGEERLTDITPLCDNCHAMVHTLERRGDLGIDLTGFVSEQRAARYLSESQERDGRLAVEAAEIQRQKAPKLAMSEAKRMGLRLNKLRKRAEKNGTSHILVPYLERMLADLTRVVELAKRP